MPDRRRILIGILVYNGRVFVPAAIRSAARLQRGGVHDVEVIVLDDASPEPGFSDEIAALSNEVGVQYYRSPRNLGIPRNMNLALLRALDQGFDHVVLCNSDVLLPQNLADSLISAAEGTQRVASVTAWSNNVSIFSLPNRTPNESLGHQGAVDFLADALAGEFAERTLTVPTGVGFCMLMPTDVVREVGLLDPVFGRGYCEEVDWCLRASRAGYVNTLGLGSFVFHMGNATTREAGLLDKNQFTSWANEAVIDLRYPDYRADLSAFDSRGELAPLMAQALQAIIADAAREWGYSVEASWLHRRNAERVVQFVVEPDGNQPLLTGRFQGFEVGIPIVGGNVLSSVEQFVGRPPAEISVFDRGRVSTSLLDAASERQLPTSSTPAYPERV